VPQHNSIASLRERLHETEGLRHRRRVQRCRKALQRPYRRWRVHHISRAECVITTHRRRSPCQAICTGPPVRSATPTQGLGRREQGVQWRQSTNGIDCVTPPHVGHGGAGVTANLGLGLADRSPLRESGRTWKQHPAHGSSQSRGLCERGCQGPAPPETAPASVGKPAAVTRGRAGSRAFRANRSTSKKADKVPLENEGVRVGLQLWATPGWRVERAVPLRSPRRCPRVAQEKTCALRAAPRVEDTAWVDSAGNTRAGGRKMIPIRALPSGGKDPCRQGEIRLLGVRTGREATPGCSHT